MMKPSGKSRKYRLRPTWHKAVGAAILAGGAGLFFFCEFNIAGIHHYGGHIWYLVGTAAAIGSTWWFGLFDPA